MEDHKAMAYQDKTYDTKEIKSEYQIVMNNIHRKLALCNEVIYKCNTTNLLISVHIRKFSVNLLAPHFH